MKYLKYYQNKTINLEYDFPAKLLSKVKEKIKDFFTKTNTKVIHLRKTETKVINCQKTYSGRNIHRGSSGRSKIK